MHSPPSAARRISSSIWTAKAGTLFRSGSPTTGRGISLSSAPTSGCKVLRSRGDAGGGALLLGRRRDRRAGDSRRLGLPALLDHACELLALLRQVMTPDAPGPFGPLQMLPRRHRFVALGHRARPATGSA